MPGYFYSIGIAVIAAIFGLISTVKFKRKIPNWLFYVLTLVTIVLVAVKEYTDYNSKVQSESDRKVELNKLKEDLLINFDASLIKYGLRYNEQTQEVYQIENVVRDVLNQKETTELNEAIKNLLNRNDEIAVNAADFLKNYFDRKQISGFELTDKQLYNLNKVFLNRPNTYLTNRTLCLLFFKQNVYATAYCERILKGEVIDGDNTLIETAKYLNKLVDIKYFLPMVVSFIKKDPLNNWRFIFSACNYLSDKHFSVIINSEEILNSIPSNYYQSISDNLLYSLDLKRKEILKNSLLQLRANFNKKVSIE